MEYIWSRFSGSEGSFSRAILSEAGLAFDNSPHVNHVTTDRGCKRTKTSRCAANKKQNSLLTESKATSSQGQRNSSHDCASWHCCLHYSGRDTHFRCLFVDCGAQRVSSNPWNFPSSPSFPYFPSPPLYPPPSQLESNFHIPILLCTQRGAFYWILLLTTWHLVE